MGLKGWIITGTLAVLLVAFAALPMVAGTVIVMLLPGVGVPNDNFGLPSLLHMLWIFPVIYMVENVIEGLVAYFDGIDFESKPVQVASFVVQWLALTLMYAVFFKHPEGAALAAFVSMILAVPFLAYLEKKNENPANDEK